MVWRGIIIYIDYPCTKEDGCSIDNDGEHAYECHPEYKSSLFVNTAGSDKANKFSVLDYEVFGIMKLEDCNNSLKQTQKKTRHKKYWCRSINSASVVNIYIVLLEKVYIVIPTQLQ